MSTSLSSKLFRALPPPNLLPTDAFFFGGARYPLLRRFFTYITSHFLVCAYAISHKFICAHFSSNLMISLALLSPPCTPAHHLSFFRLAKSFSLCWIPPAFYSGARRPRLESLSIHGLEGPSSAFCPGRPSAPSGIDVELVVHCSSFPPCFLRSSCIARAHRCSTPQL
ncbi:hypothetical protein FB451DRAFT_431698 [Mycena latifolia]|nr:hypothetical protein FB451DRAFT_431698 [Mycena latifolia]